MNIQDFLSSGVIEMYCMGISDDEQTKQVEELAWENPEVRNEIASVSEALGMYAMSFSQSPPSSLKNKILEAVAGLNKDGVNLQFPPRMSLSSTAEEWLLYLSDNNITAPEQYDNIYLMDLPGNKEQSTYVVWAKKGAVVEESHDDEDEFLLMLKGHCSITLDGRIGYYSAGDILFIPKKSVHRAEILSDEPMLVIGQRVAA